MMNKSQFERQIIDEYKRLIKTKTDVSPWDVFISLVKGRADIYLITLKADMIILEQIANGLSVTSVARRLGISTKDVRDVAFTWGMEPLEETLDFQPILVYNSGMTAEQLKTSIEEIIFESLSISTYQTIVENMEQYINLKELLDEEERNE